jgi:hypothetical protein
MEFENIKPATLVESGKSETGRHIPRATWVLASKIGSFLDQSSKTLSYQSAVNKRKLILILPSHCIKLNINCISKYHHLIN